MDSSHNGHKRLAFSDFSEINMQRHKDWPTEPNVSVDEWSLSQWGIAIAEETGELCGAIKRLNRFRSGIVIKRRKSRIESEAEGIAAIKEEIGGIVTYLDLMAHSVGLRLEDCIRDTFNEVSEREGFHHRV